MHRNSKQAIEGLLLQFVDFSLAGVIFLVPLLMGGRHAIGQLALTVLAVTTACAWAVRECLRDDAAWRSAVATPLILLATALVGLQVVPLPPWLLARLAPRMADVLTLWNAGSQTTGSLGYWPCLSFTPAETLAGLVLFLDFALLFFVVVQRIGRVEDIERLLRWCALSAVIMASFGIVQLLAGNGRFFWFYEHPYTNTFDGARGSFSNRNHFAQFLALGIGPLVWWLQDAMRRRRNGVDAYLLCLALGIVLLAGLLSLSRGGIAAMLLAAAIATTVCYRTVSSGRRLLGVLAAAGVLIGVSLAIFGLDRVANRLEDYSSGSLERLDRAAGRRTIWTAAAKAIPDRLLLGAGVGSFAEVYPMYTGFLVNEGIEFTHAENSYLQVAVETGVVGLVLTLAGIMLVGSWCVGGLRRSVPTRLRMCAAAIAGSLAAIVAHALVDFVWYVPACMAIVAVLAACALRVRQMRGQGSGVRGRKEAETGGQGNKDTRRQVGTRRQREDRRFDISLYPCLPASLSSRSPIPPRVAWTAAAMALACVGAWMIADRIGPAVAQTYWDPYLAAHDAFKDQPSAELSPQPDAETQERWIAVLENVVRWQPSHARAHLALAECHRRLFDALVSKSENPMSLASLRDAALQSRFPSRAALVEWLSRAVGRHWTHLDEALNHIRTALALCPVEGRAYVYLADLSFLAGADGAIGRAYVGQALRVRPFDGAVLYAAANEALLTGDRARWIEYSRRAFHSGRPQQQQILADLVAVTSTENLPAVIASILQEFQPDLEAVRFLHCLCARRCPAEPLTALMRCRAEKAEGEAATLSPVEGAKVWLEAQQLYGQLGDDAAASRCIGNALQCDSGNYDAHYQGARFLLKQGRFAEALSHVRWCLQRTPNNPALADMLREALKGQLDGQRRAATEGEHRR